MKKDEIVLAMMEAGFPFQDEFPNPDRFVIDFTEVDRLYDCFFYLITKTIDGGNYQDGWTDGYAASMRDERERLDIGMSQQ